MDNHSQSRPKRDVSLDVALTILASEHRRHVLRLLLAAPDSAVEVDEIAGRVADGVDADRQSLEIDLVHNHLPRLADAGIVEFDRRSGAVRRTDAIAELEPLLERCEQWTT